MWFDCFNCRRIFWKKRQWTKNRWVQCWLCCSQETSRFCENGKYFAARVTSLLSPPPAPDCTPDHMLRTVPRPRPTINKLGPVSIIRHFLSGRRRELAQPLRACITSRTERGSVSILQEDRGLSFWWPVNNFWTFLGVWSRFPALTTPAFSRGPRVSPNQYSSHRCSRAHDKPDSSTTILVPGMYNHYELEQSLIDEYDTGEEFLFSVSTLNRKKNLWPPSPTVFHEVPFG